jgi:hypothetical protein
MDYMRVLKGAFQTTWRHKRIWLFAFLATVFGAGESSPRFRYSIGYRFPSDQALPQPLSELLGNPLVRSFVEHPEPYLAALGALTLLSLLIRLVGRSFTRAAMIAMVDEVERTGATSIPSGAKAGAKTLPAVLGVSLLLAIPSVVLLIAILALAFPVFYPMMKEVLSSLIVAGGFEPSPPINSQYPPFEALSALFPSLFCLIGATWLIALLTSILERLSIRSSVLEQLGVLGSIRRGWTIGLKTLGYVIITVIMFAVVAFVVTLIVAMPMMALSLVSLVGLVQDPQHALNWAVIIIGSVYSLLASAVVGTILSSLVETTWTKLYIAGAARPSA